MATTKITFPRRGLAEDKTKINIKTEGFHGDACLTSTKKLLDSLGVAGTIRPTAEMYEKNEQVHVTE